MSSAPKLNHEWLPIMAAAFPQTFFVDPRQVRPLQVDIHLDLPATLPEGMTPALLKRFMFWYTRRPAYQRALAEGRNRVDLNGADAGAIDEPIRRQARERWDALLNRKKKPSAAAATAQPATRVPTEKTPVGVSPINLEALCAMAVDAKLEIILKFTTLPNAKPAGQGKQAFALKTPDGQFVTVEVGNKVWNKLLKAAADWPEWIAALSGAMGPRTAQGFPLINAGLQVFERKPKAPAEAAPPVDAKPVPAAAEPVAAVPVALESAPPATATDAPGPQIGKAKLSLKSRAKAG